MGRVLVIDDEEHVRKTVGLALKQGGYEVFEAEDGEQAIALVQSYPVGFSLHTIICDIGLPKVNGANPMSWALQRYLNKVWWTILSSQPSHKPCWTRSGGQSASKRC